AASVLAMLAAWTPAVFVGVLAVPGPYALRCALGALLAWGLPAAALGAIPPALARASLRGGGREGTTVGRVYAAGTVGAVVACVLTSPVLVPAIGTIASLAVASLALAICAALVSKRAETPWIAGVVAVALFAVLPFPW